MQTPLGRRILLSWLLFCLLFHAWLAMQIGLSVDEAHYALYGLHPAWSYFDHPPLVGWLQMPILALGGGDVALRFLPLLCWGLTAWGLYRWSPLACWLFSLSPLHHLLALAWVPDTLLMPLTLGVMALCLRWTQGDGSRARGHWCLWLGLLLGLAGLTKYSAIFLALGVGVFVLLQRGWPVLRQGVLWWALVLALLCITPVLVWNAAHDWASFRYQFGHAGGDQSWRVERVLAYVLIQCLVVGPLVLAGLLQWRRAANMPRSARWLMACCGLPLLVVVGALAGRGSALPHWTAPAWVALMPLAAAGLAQSQWRRGVLWALAATQLALLTLVVALILSAGSPRLPAQGLVGNPWADLYGWSLAGERARALAVTLKQPRVVVHNWTLASRMAWYARPLPVQALDGKNPQFEWWFGRLQTGQDALFVNWSQMPAEPPLLQKPIASDSALGQPHAGGFERCVLQEELAVPWPAPWLWGADLPPLSRFGFYLCQNWQAP